MFLRNRSKQQKAQIDTYLNQIVTQMQQQSIQLNWKQISSKLLRNHNIELNFKSCYYRWKNYINKEIDTKFKATLEQKKKIFQLHCQGVNNMEIREKMSLNNVNDNTFKNACKSPKQATARTLKTIYEQHFKIINIPQEFLEKQHFRIFLILFSSCQLLHYYLQKGIRIIAFQQLAKKYQQLLDEDINLIGTQQKKKNHLQRLQLYKKNIKSELLIILEIYQEIYNDSSKKRKLIGRKDKLLDEKFKYLIAIMFKIPIKIQYKPNMNDSIRTINSLNENLSTLRKENSINIDQSSQMEGKQLYYFANEKQSNYAPYDVLFFNDEPENGFEFDKDKVKQKTIQNKFCVLHTNSIQTLFSAFEIEEQIN